MKTTVAGGEESEDLVAIGLVNSAFRHGGRTGDNITNESI
jgi:hypothetical protein